MADVTPPRPTHVELVVKSPSITDAADLRLSVPLRGTVRLIKEALQQAHPEHPAPSTQRLIFAGRLLQDNTQTADVLRQVPRHAPPPASHRTPPLPLARELACCMLHDASA